MLIYLNEPGGRIRQFNLLDEALPLSLLFEKNFWFRRGESATYDLRALVPDDTDFYKAAKNFVNLDARLKEERAVDAMAVDATLNERAYVASFMETRASMEARASADELEAPRQA